MPGKQLKKDGWLTKSVAELLLLILHGVSMKYKGILKGFFKKLKFANLKVLSFQRNRSHFCIVNAKVR